MAIPRSWGCSMINKTFGRWTVIASAGKNKKGDAYWECRCACGNIKAIRGSSLLIGDSTSCGCFKKDARKTHGKTGSATYSSWRHMMRRCYSSKDQDYRHYGGRGITVCPRWHTFEHFFADMGEVPEGLTLGRKKNNEPYSPENCQWETRKQQGQNTRRLIVLTFGDKSQNLKQWAADLKMKHGTLRHRIVVLKWSTEKALTTPVIQRGA